MTRITRHLATTPPSRGPVDIPQPSTAHQPEGRWSLGTGAFRKISGTHSPALSLAGDICKGMSALPPDQCADQLVADAMRALQDQVDTQL